MNLRKFNWQIWAGFLLTFAASLSYPLLFVKWPLTRDFPWTTILLYVIAAVLLFVGIRRAFSPGRSRLAKVVSSALALLSVVIMGLFLFSILIMAKWLPSSASAPKVNQKAPEFTLQDSNGKSIALTDLLTAPINSAGAAVQPRGVLLVFYRGYW